MRRIEVSVDVLETRILTQRQWPILKKRAELKKESIAVSFLTNQTDGQRLLNSEFFVSQQMRDEKEGKKVSIWNSAIWRIQMGLFACA